MKPRINGRTELSLTVRFSHQTIFPRLRQLTSKSKAHGYFHPSSAAETLINYEVSQCAVCGPAHQQHHTGAALHTHSFIYHRH
jgi:hypothetical protein